jgi:hypothetical protein
MKVSLYSLVFLCLLTISCKKDKVLTPIVATFNGNTYSYTPSYCSFRKDTLFIGGTEIFNNPNQCYGAESVGICIITKKTGIFSLPNVKGSYGSIYDNVYCSMVGAQYTTDSTHSGTVNLTLLDTVLHRASGTFDFNAKGGFSVGFSAIHVSGYFLNVAW